MLEIIMPTLWTCFALYAAWYFTSAKHYAPLTFDEAKILWKIHKQKVYCNSGTWREIKRGGKIIGFECGCGYKHIQKRPLVVNTPAHIHQQASVLDELHAPYKST